MPKVILFDIDNTLLYTGGAGSYAMNITFNEMFGVTDGFARVEFSGRTDRWILETGLTEHGIDGGVEKHFDTFTARYYEILPMALEEREGYLMPGFPDLLRSLKHAGATLGLATGNFSRAAEIKIGHYGLDGFFEGGGFGEASNSRGDMVAAAIRAVAGGAASEDIVVVGDTPHDVKSALDNDVIGVGVATGTYTAEELVQSGAHVAFPDFSDWAAASKRLLTLHRSG